MNTIRMMARLFNAGRRSQQLLQLMGKNKYNNIKTMLSMVGVIMTAVSTVQKMNVDMKKPVEMMKNKFNNQSKQRDNMAMIPITEFSEELAKDVFDKDSKK